MLQEHEEMICRLVEQQTAVHRGFQVGCPLLPISDAVQTFCLNVDRAEKTLQSITLHVVCDGRGDVVWVQQDVNVAEGCREQPVDLI